jgi:hypothetical protein
MLFRLLEMLDGEPGYFRPPQAATEENRDHCIVACGTQALTSERCKESFPLIGGKPIPNAHSVLLYALDTPNSRRKVRAQKAAVGSFVCQPANGGETQVDRGGGILCLFEIDPVGVMTVC